MIQTHQHIKDANGKDIGVFLPIEDYKKMLEELEELEDIRAFDEAKNKNEETIPLREAIKLRKQQNG